MTRALLDWVPRPADLDLGPSTMGGWGRRVLIGLAVLFGIAVLVAGLVGMATGPRARTTQVATPRVSPTPAGQSAAGARSTPGPGLGWRTPPTVVPPGTPLQEQYDQAFSEGLGSLSGMAAAGSLTVAAPVIGGGWPSLPVEVTPERWAEAFTTGLLTVDYAHQGRPALASWLQAQEAPELIPGVPSAVADKVLYISLLDPDLFGGQPTPIASPARWAADARDGLMQTVSHLIIQIDPGWAQMTAAGWQPTDLRMTEEDVSGVLTLRAAGTVTSRHFALQVIVGSARWHDAYGTVAVAGWQER